MVLGGVLGFRRAKSKFTSPEGPVESSDILSTAISILKQFPSSISSLKRRFTPHLRPPSSWIFGSKWICNCSGCDKTRLQRIGRYLAEMQIVFTYWLYGSNLRYWTWTQIIAFKTSYDIRPIYEVMEPRSIGRSASLGASKLWPFNIVWSMHKVRQHNLYRISRWIRACPNWQLHFRKLYVNQIRCCPPAAYRSSVTETIQRTWNCRSIKSIFSIRRKTSTCTLQVESQRGWGVEVS